MGERRNYRHDLVMRWRTGFAAIYGEVRGDLGKTEVVRGAYKIVSGSTSYLSVRHSLENLATKKCESLPRFADARSDITSCQPTVATVPPKTVYYTS